MNSRITWAAGLSRWRQTSRNSSRSSRSTRMRRPASLVFMVASVANGYTFVYPNLALFPCADATLGRSGQEGNRVCCSRPLGSKQTRHKRATSRNGPKRTMADFCGFRGRDRVCKRREASRGTGCTERASRVEEAGRKPLEVRRGLTLSLSLRRYGTTCGPVGPTLLRWPAPAPHAASIFRNTHENRSRA